MFSSVIIYYFIMVTDLQRSDKAFDYVAKTNIKKYYVKLSIDIYIK